MMMRKPRSCGPIRIDIADNKQIMIVVFMLLHLLCVMVFCDTSHLANNTVEVVQKSSPENLISSENGSDRKHNSDNYQNIKTNADNLNELLALTEDSFRNTSNEGSLLSSLVDRNELYKINGSLSINELLLIDTPYPTDNVSFLSIENEEYYMSFTQEQLSLMSVNNKISRDIDMDPCKSGKSWNML